jgi:PPOX class probable F420-dependent enzyme
VESSEIPALHFAPVGAFNGLVRQRTVVVTTHRRDGSPVPTPVNVVVSGDHAYFRTWSTSGKAKRLRRDPRVLIGPSSIRGKPTGPSIAATARLLGPDEEGRITQALARKYPLLHGRIVPFIHRLRRYTTVHYELTAS